ncbi:hypothetical protein PHLGIDRAFT_418085 [Phlebiopsis gigantea 11061_1 CR5-6]|uniref:Uncharacterized protein n=1 Tax=Phlebiopsis gigantea (strain 11061_1 CR5-6) TaxID=745531 RepID=A0A0C3SDJ0_PHLG1|nr:hypothetical protein PHLGIDRAFT_418085 [Phlebiopsis gigantea 11061_1 CR5-6]
MSSCTSSGLFQGAGLLICTPCLFGHLSWPHSREEPLAGAFGHLGLPVDSSEYAFFKVGPFKVCLKYPGSWPRCLVRMCHGYAAPGTRIVPPSTEW